MTNKIAGFFEDLGLIKQVPNLERPETPDLSEWKGVSTSEQQEILQSAEQVIVSSVERVRRAPGSGNDYGQSGWAA